MRKPSKEQIKDLLLLIAVICLFKIAFFGIETNIKTSRIGGIPVDATISSLDPIDIEGEVTIDGKDAFSMPIEVLLTR